MKRVVLVAASLLVVVGAAAIGLAHMEPTPRETVQVLTVPLPPIAPAAAAAPVPSSAPTSLAEVDPRPEAKPEPATKKAKGKEKARRSVDG